MSTNTRERAYSVLSKIELGEPLEAVLSSELNALESPQDKSFLAELVKGTTRFRGRFDYLINKFIKRDCDSSIRIILRLGLYQLFNCNSVPDYAAVNETVNVARKVGFHKLAPFVNAVLQNIRRTVERDEHGLIGLFPSLEKDPVQYLTSWHSHPEWIVERWLKKFSASECDALCAHNNCPAPLTLHLKPGFIRSELFEYLDGIDVGYYESESELSAVIIEDRLGKSKIDELMSKFPGLIVQDQSVQSAIDFISIYLEGRILDMCSAPGGKTINTAWRMTEDSTLVAMDSVEKRMQKVVENLCRVNQNEIPLVIADGLHLPFKSNSFDTVLLDGPCSGTGVIRHYPDGRWLLNEEKIHENGELLFRLAQNAIDILAPNGKLIFATCSLEPEENEVVIRRLTESDNQLSVLESGKYWLPQDVGADGFFIAVIEKAK
jgi:16S rRNA (cytosine967-C5)-methyltransferase